MTSGLVGDLAFRLPEYGKPWMASLQPARDVSALNINVHFRVAAASVVIQPLVIASWCAALLLQRPCACLYNKMRLINFDVPAAWTLQRPNGLTYSD